MAAVRIMLVDDSRTMRTLSRSVLEQLGYSEIEEACNGQDALSKIGAFEPDLLLVDWDMPTMDGLAFIKAFRKTDKTTPVIMVTTEVEKSRVIEAIQAGVNNYVFKPLAVEALGHRIGETLARCRAA